MKPNSKDQRLTKFVSKGGFVITLWAASTHSLENSIGTPDFSNSRFTCTGKTPILINKSTAVDDFLEIFNASKTYFQKIVRKEMPIRIQNTDEDVEPEKSNQIKSAEIGCRIRRPMGTSTLHLSITGLNSV